MGTQPPAEHASTPPEQKTGEPVTAVTTSETTPPWARTVPVAPADGGADAASTTSQPQSQAVPKREMEKGEPDWAHRETSPPEDPSKPDTAVPQKATPEWARTVPATAEGHEPAVASKPPEVPAAEAPVVEASATEAPATEPPATEPPATEPPATEPPRAVAADAVKKTWPPVADAAPAPPEETDIWPPEPPTERAMPAWPPPSEFKEAGREPGEVITSWPGSFDAAKPAAAPAGPAPAPAAAESKPNAPPAPTKPPTVPPASAPTQPAVAPTPPAVASTPPAVASTPPAIASTPPAAAASQPSAAQAASPTEPPAPTQKPSWAPQKDPAKSSAFDVDWPAPVAIPAWAPRIRIGGTETPEASRQAASDAWEPKASTPAPAPAAPTPAPAAPTPAPVPTPPAPRPVASIPPARSAQPSTPPPPAVAPAPPAQPAAKPSWEVVETHPKVEAKEVGITPEDRSYAEWFAWAKRGGAPASACHAAAQGAFQALASGKDVATAVQWATAAMSRPPVAVPAARQTYCAWFSLANIDLNLDQHRAHAFANAAVHALDAGADAASAHAAGMAAAGIR